MMSGAPVAQAIRFGVVGASGTLINLIVFALLHDLRLASLLCGAVAFVVACQYNFLLHSRVSFRSGARPTLGGAARFLALSSATLGLNLSMLSGLQHVGASALVAQAAGIAAGFPVNFLGARAWVFRAQARAATAS